MGLAMGRLLGVSSRLTKRLQARILMLGLDAAGKTTILYRLKTGGEVASAATASTVAFNVETIEYKSISFTFWDVAGSAQNRPLWKHYFHGTQGVVFVVDSSDRERIPLARDELKALLNEEELRDAALLVLANKQDLPNAMTAAEMARELGLHQSSSLGNNRRWHIIQSSCATTSGQGGLCCCEGMDWLCTNINMKVR